MALRHHESDGFPACSRRHGEAAIESRQSAGEPVDVMGEVVEPLLRRADLLSQLLRIGYTFDPQEREAQLGGRTGSRDLR